MPVYNTHVNNQYGEAVRVVVRYTGNRSDDFWLADNEVRNVRTGTYFDQSDTVVVMVYKKGENHYNEERTIPYDRSVVIRKGGNGGPKIIIVKMNSLSDSDPELN